MRRAPTLFLLVAAAHLVGCDGKPFRRMMLVGGWAPPGQACDSQGGVFYDRDGSWAGYNVSGRWTLDGRRLRTRVTLRGGFDQPAHKVSGEKPSFATILALSQTALTLRLEDGSTQRLERCRR
jgi:hypothetical protein